MSTYFQTGHLGFIGSHLYKKLIELGHEVVTDMRYLHTRKYDAIIHLASKNNIKNEFDAELIESNIILTKEIFKVPTRIIYASSCVAAYPLNPYAYSKLYAEHLGKIHGNAIGLRFHNVYGSGNSKGLIWWLMQQPDGARITVRGEQQERDYINVENIIEKIIFYLRNDFTGIREVGTGIGTQTMDVVNLYQKLSGKSFIIDIEEAGSNEPPSMVAETPVQNFITLEEGLAKLINNA